MPSAPPETRYAKSGDVNIAYQVIGDGPLDLVLVPGLISHLELELGGARATRTSSSGWRPSPALILSTSAAPGSRTVAAALPALEQRMDDVRAVMDAAGSSGPRCSASRRAAPMSALFAATYPQRVSALVLLGSVRQAPLSRDDYPWARPSTERQRGSRTARARTGATSADLATIARQRRREPSVQRSASAGPASAPARGRREASILHERRDRRPRRAAGDPGADARAASSGRPRRAGRGRPRTSPSASRARATSSFRATITRRGLATPSRCSTRSRSSSPASRRGAGAGSGAGDRPVHRHRRLDRHARPSSATGDGARVLEQPPRARPAAAGALPRHARSTRRATAFSPRSTARRAPSAARWRSATRFVRSGSRCAPACIPARSRSSDAASRGIAVHTGARVAAQAEPGEVLVSSTVQDLVAGLRSRVRGPRHARAQGRPRGVAALRCSQCLTR